MTRVGIIGLGHNGAAHLEAHLRVGRSRVVALCDRNPGRLAEVGRQFGIGRLYASAQELCDQPDIDAVSVNTGDPFHVEPFAAAVRAGKHVLVEKPVANSIEQIETMAAAARQAPSGLKMAVGYVLRFNPTFEAVHVLCRAGRLGRIFYMEADYIHNLLYQIGQTDAFTGENWYLAGEQPMVGGGSHPLDLLRWFSGQEVVEVAGYANHLAFPEMKNDDCQVALYRFDGGAIAKVAALYAPMRDYGPYNELRLYGTGGTVVRNTVALARDRSDVHPPFEPIPSAAVAGHPYEPEIADWLTAIETGSRPRCDFFDGCNSTAAALAAVESISAGRALPVPVYTAPA